MEKSLSFGDMVQLTNSNKAEPSSTSADPKDPSFEFRSRSTPSTSLPRAELLSAYGAILQQQPRRAGGSRISGQSQSVRRVGGRNSMDLTSKVTSSQNAGPTKGRHSLDLGPMGRGSVQVAPEGCKANSDTKKKSPGLFGSIFSGCRDCKVDKPVKHIGSVAGHK